MRYNIALLPKKVTRYVTFYGMECVTLLFKSGQDLLVCF